MKLVYGLLLSLLCTVMMSRTAHKQKRKTKEMKKMDRVLARLVSAKNKKQARGLTVPLDPIIQGVLEAIPPQPYPLHPFDKEYDYGDITGGNISIILPKIKNPMVINSFPTDQYIEKNKQEVTMPSKFISGPEYDD